MACSLILKYWFFCSLPIGRSPCDIKVESSYKVCLVFYSHIGSFSLGCNISGHSEADFSYFNAGMVCYMVYMCHLSYSGCSISRQLFRGNKMNALLLQALTIGSFEEGSPWREHTTPVKKENLLINKGFIASYLVTDTGCRQEKHYYY